MHEESYTITCLIMKAGGPYYKGSDWDNDIGKACHYASIHQAEAALESILSRRGDAAIYCVIQNKSFDYYDGKSFVYDLTEAKLYMPQEAESELKRLNARKI